MTQDADSKPISPRKRFHFTDDLAESSEAYHAALDQASLKKTTRKRLKIALRCLLEEEVSTFAELRKSLEAENLSPTHIPELLDHLEKEIRKFGLILHRPSRTEVRLQHNPLSCALVLFQISGVIKTETILDRLQAINNEGDRLREGVKIKQAGAIIGEYDAFALVEGPSLDAVFQNILEIKEDEEIGDNIRTITLPVLFGKRWDLLEL